MRADRITIVVLSAIAVAVITEGRAAAQDCDPPQVLIVLDHSSSMGERAPLADGTLKWNAAVSSLTDITRLYESSIDFGLMVFPSAGECTAGTVLVPVGPDNAAEIATALPGLPPYAGNWTPMSQSLNVAADYTPLRDATRHNYVALITDGWQWCDPYDYATRFDPVRATETLTARSITTFVIGFGDGVDTLTLNQCSVAAGTELPGCDPTSDDPARADNCYYQVDALSELRDALNDIVVSITGELCDGLDNDCDGFIDEDLSRPCATLCGGGEEICVGGSWTDCDAPLPLTDVCDGIDNDCDGITDPGCDCADGETRPCGSDVGECSSGTQVCDDGEWLPCDGDVGPSAEICDGLDNDCNGVIDPGCWCAEGDRRECGIHVGACEFGEQVCIAGQWGDCEGGVGPSDEICDGIDNDCDNIVDEGCHCIDGEVQACGLSEGACEPGQQTCVDGRWTSCDGGINPTPEICDGIDNDCDGLVDEDAPCEPGYICEGGTCVNDGPPDNPCDEVTCGPNQYCLDGTCVDYDGWVPTPDDGPPVNPPPSDLGNEGCDCHIVGGGRERSAWLVIAALATLVAVVWRRL